MLCSLTLTSKSVPKPSSILYVLLCAQCCYLLDRVKISDARQDPADALALPVRAVLFSKHASRIRALILIELAICIGIGWIINPILVLIPLLALAVVQLYAGRKASPASTSTRPRLKDLPGIKAFLIASGHIALSLVVLWSDHSFTLDENLQSKLLPILGAWLIVSADAMLCDIDDHDADLVYATQSLAVLLGPRSSWNWAFILTIAGSILITFNPFAQSSSIAIGITLSLGTLITLKNSNHRDLVDARLLPIVLFWIWAFNGS